MDRDLDGEVVGAFWGRGCHFTLRDRGGKSHGWEEAGGVKINKAELIPARPIIDEVRWCAGGLAELNVRDRSFTMRPIIISCTFE